SRFGAAWRRSGQQWKKMDKSGVDCKDSTSDSQLVGASHVPWKRSNQNRRQGSPEDSDGLPPVAGGALGPGSVRDVGARRVGTALSPAGLGGDRAAVELPALHRSHPAAVPRAGQLLRTAGAAGRAGADPDSPDSARERQRQRRRGGERPAQSPGGLESRAVRFAAAGAAVYG